MRQLERLVEAARLGTGFETDVFFDDSRGTKSRANARQAVYYLARSLTSSSYTELAAFFGKHHTTVLHGVNAFSRKLDQGDVHSAELVRTIEEQFSRLSEI